MSKTVEAARAALEGPHGRDLLALMQDAVLDRSGSPDPAAAALARSLGWVEDDAAPLRLTALGGKIGDSIREFTLWHERAGALPSQERHPALQPASFAGSRVLEVGSGAGVNLLSVREAASRVVGIDVESLYLGMSRVLGPHFDTRGPAGACAAGERLPFATGSFDAVLCLGSLQYTEIPATLAEMGRVLTPGGRAVIAMATFSQLLGFLAGDLRRPAASQLVRRARTVVNTLGVALAGRRVSRGRSGSSTAAPVYPPRAWLARTLRDAKLELCGDPVAISAFDTLFVAERSNP